MNTRPRQPATRARAWLAISLLAAASACTDSVNPTLAPGGPTADATAFASATVSGPAKASWSAGCYYAQLMCTFDASSSTSNSPIVSYRWDWGNGRSETHAVPTATNHWAAGGFYNVTLTITDSQGQTGTSSYLLQVGVPVGTPPYTVFNTTGCVSTTCTFDSSPSVGSSAIVRSWSFGDGTTAGDIVAPSHAFAAPGVYGVLLKLTDASGLSGYFASAVVVGLQGGIGGMGMNGDCVSVPGTCSFFGYAVGNNTPIVLSWDWGDGTKSGNLSNVSHTYAKAGTYVVMLVATDALGGVGASAVPVTVSAPPPPADAPPVAAFNWTCTGQAILHQCAFDASASSDDVGITSYKWDWGNGRSETKLGKTTRNTWPSAGTYLVTLTVTDTKGQTNSVQLSVGVP